MGAGTSKEREGRRLGGAAAGGLIGVLVLRGCIGGVFGLGGGEVGNSGKNEPNTNKKRREENQAEIQRQRQQIDQLKQRQEY